MKNTYFCNALFTLSLIASPLLAFAAGSGGGSGPGGGNTDAIQFRKLARGPLAQIIQISQDQDLVANAKKILAKVDSNEVNVVMVNYPLMYLGGEVDAVNYPEQNRIEVNEDRINKKFFNDRLQLSIHEFAGLAKVPDVNNIVSSKLSNPTILSIKCSADIFGMMLADGTFPPGSAHTNLVLTEIRDSHSNEFEGYRFVGKVSNIYVDADLITDEIGKYKETQITIWEAYPDVTSNAIAYGWGGRIWNVYESKTHPGYRIDIECNDDSISDDRTKYRPDSDDMPK